MSPGTAYNISGWVRLASGTNQTAKLTIRKIDGSSTTYQQVATGTANLDRLDAIERELHVDLYGHTERC